MEPTTPQQAHESGSPRRAAVRPTPVTHASYARRSLVWLLLPVGLGVLALGLHLARDPQPTVDYLAVLPFATNGTDTATVVLAQGIREAVAGSLADLPGVTMIAASSLTGFEGAAPEPREVGRALDVRFVVTGRVDLQGEMLAVSAELLSAEGGDRLWGGGFVRPASELLAVEDDLATQLASAVRPQLAPAARDAIRRRATGSLAARQLYMKARFHTRKRTARGFEDAISCFKQAIYEDPSYALAYAGLAECYALPVATSSGAMPPREAMPAARAAAESALRVDPNLAAAHAVLGLVRRSFEWNRDAAERSLRRATELAPSNASAHQWYGETLAERGRLREAEVEIRRAIRLDPLSPETAAALAHLAFLARDLDLAVGRYRAALTKDMAFEPARLGLALTLAQRGAFPEALATVNGRGAVDTPARLAVRGYLQARTGSVVDARATAATLAAAAERGYVSACGLAMVPLGLGDVDTALAWLGKAADERCPSLGSLAIDPLFDPLRSDPRFTDLVRRIGLAK